MRRFIPGGTRALKALAILLALALAQIQADAASKKKEPPPPKVDETVGDLAFVPQAGETRVEGVGLVTGLENTGSDPPPSWWRTQLVEEMGKANVEHPNKILANPQFSMVIVRMTIRTGASPEDRFDVEVEVPPACGTKSLAGGYLMMTRLREVMVAGGSPRTSHDLALAQGPVMIGNDKDPSNPKVGRVLGGGKIKKESPFTLVIMENRRSVRTAKMLETVINARFHQSEAGTQKGAATGKTDGHLTLKVPSTYHQNQLRFFRVVQLLPMVDTPELRERRITAWGKELLDPKTSGVAAMKLEGLGPSAGEPLRQALQNENAQVRFFAGEALAYMDDPAGVEALGETAARMPQFRAYALAALAAMDQTASHVKLRKLMDEPDFEVRYGAFNALRTLDPNDPALGRVGIIEQPRTDEEEDTEGVDSMAIALSSPSRRPRAEDPFALYMVDSEGPPIVHVSRSRRSEIVVFGRNQQLLPPIVLGTGAILLNAADKNTEVEISKIVPTRSGDGDLKYRTSLDVGEVIRRVSNLGASYPEVVAILEAAHRQKNLPGPLVIDAVPAASPAYFEAAILGKDSTAKKDPEVKQAAAKAQPSRLRRLLNFRRGDDDSAATGKETTTAAREKDKDKATPADSREKDKAKETTTAARDAGTDGGKGGAADASPAAKKDAGVQKTGAEVKDGDESESRPRLFNLFRRRSSDEP